MKQIRFNKCKSKNGASVSEVQWQRRFFCQRKRLKNDTKTVHKRRFLKRHCHFSKRLGVWPIKLQQDFAV